MEATDSSLCLPHEESSSFSLTNAMCFSSFRADERRCSLGGETRTVSEEKRCLKRTKEDFGEAMRKMRQDVSTGEAGCHPKSRQDVAVRLLTQHKTACLLTLTPLACHEAACSEPVKRRFIAWSGRRGSNPRQPAWKAGTLPTELLPHSIYVLALAWSGCADSNRGPPAPKAGALPTAPHPVNIFSTRTREHYSTPLVICQVPLRG